MKRTLPLALALIAVGCGSSCRQSDGPSALIEEVDSARMGQTRVFQDLERQLEAYESRRDSSVSDSVADLTSVLITAFEDASSATGGSRYENGQVESQLLLVNQGIQGIVLILEQWFYENGQVESRWLELNSYSVENNISYYNSEVVRYYENGQVKSKGPMEDMLDGYTGVFESYYENGQLAVMRTYKDGELHGPYEIYYLNGQLRAKRIYTAGEQCAIWALPDAFDTLADTMILGSRDTPCPPDSEEDEILTRASELTALSAELFPLPSEQWGTREQIAEAQRLSREWFEAHPPGN
jgi:hypothetical protein